MRGFGARFPTVAPAAAVVAAAAVIVVLALAVGPVEVTTPSWLEGGGSTAFDPPAPTAPALTATPVPTPEPVTGDPLSIDVPWPAAVLVALVAAAYLVYRLVRRMPGAEARRAARRAVLGGDVQELDESVEELRDGARSAASMLSGPAPDAAEAVVAAWLALEAAAAGTGAPRSPVQTPSEFTAALLRRHHADPDAVATLLRLYHRARFAVRPDLGDHDVEAARQALGVIVGTLGAPAGSDSREVRP